jgi:hypothetical protein
VALHTIAVTFAVCVLTLLMPVAPLPSDAPGLRRFKTPEITVHLPIGQSFTMTSRALHAIGIRPTAAGSAAQGTIRLELRDTTEDPKLVRMEEMPVSDLLAAPRYRFEFAPIADSNRRNYRLDVSSSEPHSGLALWATKGSRYPAGEMFANGKARWADLAFRAYADVPSAVDLLRTPGRMWTGSGVMVLVAFGLYALLVGLVLGRWSAGSVGDGT